jgi:hypothetical protein
MSHDSQNTLYKGAIIGSLAAMTSASITHPLDVLKVRLSLLGENQKRKIRLADRYQLLRQIIFYERFPASIYSGLSATLLRQAIYSGSRFGIYHQINSQINYQNKGMPLAKRFFTTATAGVISAFISCPIDVVLVRMQAKNHNPVRNQPYRNVFHGFYSIVNNEGIISLYRGLAPLLFRGMSVTSAQFLTYETLKDELMKQSQFGDTFQSHCLSGMGAGLAATLVSTPIDVIKSRMMYAKVPYRSSFHCLTNTIKKEGPVALFKGIVPCGMRMVPHVVILWQFVEAYRKLWDNYIG